MGDSGVGDAGLAEAIEVVRGELEAAMKAGERSSVAFEVGPVELEFEVAFTKTGKGEAGLKAWVITVGGSAEVSHARAHRLKVALTPVDRATRERQMIGDIDPSSAGHPTQSGTPLSDVPQEGGDVDTT